jgi:nucleotide-binding universal stress UspA family protein
MGDGMAPGRIVVGVDGSSGARAAVFWAASQARASRCDLVISHVEPAAAPDTLGTDETAEVDTDETAGTSHTLLESSAAAASQREPSVLVGTLLLGGSISDQLVRLGATATLLVLGLKAATLRAAAGARGPVEDRVVLHARCPVVVVPPALRSLPPSYSNVLVLWTNSNTGRRALSTAAQQAELVGASLTVAAAREDHAQRNSMRNSTSSSRQTESGSALALREAVTTLGETHPALKINLVAETSDAEALLLLSDRADLLVLACHPSEDPWSIGNGLALDVVRRGGRCPVLVLPAAPIRA